METHPKGTHARLLLSSVFGPYAQDDEFGSRSINPMELYHNQVTRAQGSFSLRMFHRSWGIMMIQANISAPCTEMLAWIIMMPQERWNMRREKRSEEHTSELQSCGHIVCSLLLE